MNTAESKNISEAISILESQPAPTSCSPLINKPDLVGYLWFWKQNPSLFISVRFDDDKQRTTTVTTVQLRVPLSNISIRYGGVVIHPKSTNMCTLEFDATDPWLGLSEIRGLEDALRASIAVPLSVT